MKIIILTDTQHKHLKQLLSIGADYAVECHYTNYSPSMIRKVLSICLNPYSSIKAAQSARHRSIESHLDKILASQIKDNK